MLGAPIAECGEPVAWLPEAAAAAGVEIAFAETPHANGGPRLFLVRASLVDDVLHVAEALAERGWRLVVEDGFRTLEMQRRLAQTEAVFDRVLERTTWECGGADPSPELLTRRLGCLVAPCPKLGTHMSATAIDVSVLDRRTGRELERGGRYLEISERTPMASPFITAGERAVREAVTEAMAGRGFVPYAYEFWHYNKGDAHEAVARGDAAPARFGPVEVDLGSLEVTPIRDDRRPLTPPHELEELLAAARLRRR